MNIKRRFSFCSLFLLIKIKKKNPLIYFDIAFLPLSFFSALCRGGESFLCTSGICVPRKLQCNGYNDCDDWSDEAHCSMWQAVWGLSAGTWLLFRGLETRAFHCLVLTTTRCLGGLLLVCLSLVSKVFIFPRPT